MYWCGDSETGIRKRWLSLWALGGLKRIWREEILCGYYSKVPICCVIWYILTTYLCIFTRKDLLVLPFMFGKDGWEEFCRLDYYRCPICRGLKKEVKIKWEEEK